MNNVFCTNLCWVRQTYVSNETYPRDKLYVMSTLNMKERD